MDSMSYDQDFHPHEMRLKLQGRLFAPPIEQAGSTLTIDSTR
jgi:hypothetical protein